MPIHTPHPETRDQLYAQVAGEFERAVQLFADIKKRDARADAIRDAMKTAYLAGLDRGYDLGAHVFGQET